MDFFRKWKGKKTGVIVHPQPVNVVSLQLFIDRGPGSQRTLAARVKGNVAEAASLL
jgi:hypothetical protein